MARLVFILCFAMICGMALTRPAAAVLSCNESAGAAQARRYVEQCQMVATASHALCRPTNSCPLIQDEIRRGCMLMGRDAPTFCVVYRRP